MTEVRGVTKLAILVKQYISFLLFSFVERRGTLVFCCLIFVELFISFLLFRLCHVV